jgi:LemA protein
MAWAIGLGVIFFVAMGIAYFYNMLVGRRVRTQEAWSQIDVQLKRRYDLIPNLVETVKGYATHERETLEKVVEARSQAMGAKGVAQQAEAENMLSGALKNLFALSESYPALKANENFARLQEELASTENRIAFARQYYNDSCAGYNTACQKFPANLVANAFGFKPAVFFELEEPAEREAPKVQF